jgi:hypothetical protein
MNYTVNYQIGDIIEYTTFDGSVRRVLVDNKEVDIKNGCAGFTGNLVGASSDHFGVWGYDYQILRVLR